MEPNGVSGATGRNFRDSRLVLPFDVTPDPRCATWCNSLPGRISNARGLDRGIPARHGALCPPSTWPNVNIREWQPAAIL